MNLILRTILGRTKEIDDIIEKIQKEKDEKNPPTKWQKAYRKAKKGIKIGIKLYMAAYILGAVCVAGDYFLYRRSQIVHRSQTENTLDIRKYNVNIDGKKKRLTLIGETHQYNELENRVAYELVGEHMHFASESGKGVDDTTIGNEIYLMAIGVPLLLHTPYYNLATDRWYDSISDVAYEQENKVRALESSNAPFDNMSAGQKTKLFAGFAWAAITGPYQYFRLLYKKEKSNEEEIKDLLHYKKPLLDERDPIMGKSLIELLKKDDVNRLLANIGRLHIPGIVKYLKENAEIEEIK